MLTREIILEHLSNNKNNLLLNLISPKLTSRRRIKILESIEVINSYELVFIFCVIIRYKFSGNLIIINKNNDLSGITFIYGDIVRIDYPDQDNLLGNLIVKDEIVAEFEMQEIIDKLKGKKLGQYLVENRHLSESQLQGYLFNQAKNRLTKYMNDINLRINFNFDGESNENVVIHGGQYFETLHYWVFTVYKPEWLEIYRNYYSRLNFLIVVPDGDYAYIKDFYLVSHFFEKLKKSMNKKVTYYDLIDMINVSADDEVRLIHFMVLIGLIVENKQAAPGPLNIKSEQFQNAKLLILQKKYFEALGIMNKISSAASYDEKVRFYFLWIKLHGAFHKDHVLDFSKVKKEVSVINPLSVGLGDYNYVNALLEANLKNYRESQIYYNKAVGYDKDYARFPISKNVKINFFGSFLSFIKKITGF